jgi:predicted DsbA family dithiol-disulfide isomerase
MSPCGRPYSLAEAVRTVRFYYDVVCPYSYLESRVVEAAEDAGDLEVEWLPFELRPAPKPLLQVRGDHLRTDWTQNVYRRALALGAEIHLPRYQPRSTLPLAACLWAGEEGRLRAFKHALYDAFFCEGEDIATDAEIARAASRAGLDGDSAVAAAYDPGRYERIHAVRSEAEAAGVRGVPSLLAEDGSTHWGMGGVELLLRGEPLVPRV